MEFSSGNPAIKSFSNVPPVNFWNLSTGTENFLPNKLAINVANCSVYPEVSTCVCEVQSTVYVATFGCEQSNFHCSVNLFFKKLQQAAATISARLKTQG